MTEEIKTEEKETKKVCNCGCLEKFLVVLFASFLGALLALCLYNAAARPDFPPQTIINCPQQEFGYKKFHHFKGVPPEFKKQKFDKKGEFKGKKFRKQFDGEHVGKRPEFNKD